MQQITLQNKPTCLGIVQSEKSGLLGVIDCECNLIVPFEYSEIETEMSVGGIIEAKKGDKKCLIEIGEYYD